MATIAPHTVYTKTAKGILEIRNKATRLPRELAGVLEMVDGDAGVSVLQDRSGLTAPQFHQALNALLTDGYIKAVVSSSAAAPHDTSAVPFDSPADNARLSMEVAAHALASAEAAKLAQEEGRAALEARLRAETEARARLLAETRLNAESRARASADAAARAAQHARDQAEQDAALASDPQAREEALATAREAATAAMRARAEAQARVEAEERARAVVEEKTAAEQRAREDAQSHGEGEQRAQQRAAAESRAREALQAQIDAAASLRAQTDANARARLHDIEQAAHRARAEAEALSQAQPADAATASETLRFDDLAQKLTARVTSERRAREEAGRRSRGLLDAAPAPAASSQDAPPLASGSGAGQSARGAEPQNGDPEALPAIDLGSDAGRSDIKHVTPEHVPSALERAMMERQALSEADAQPEPVGPPTSASAASAGRAQTTAAAAEVGPVAQPAQSASPGAVATPGAKRGTTRSAPPSFEPKHELQPATPAMTAENGAASAKASPTLQEDEPLNERLNVDRAAHDIIAETAEERRKAEAAAVSRNALDIRRRRQEEEARRIAREQRAEHRRKLTRSLGLTAVALPIAAVAWLQFVPLNGYVPDAQNALSARLNQPTTVATVRYVLLPTPRVVLEGVRIGSAQAVHIDRVDARVWPTAFIAGPIEFDTVDLKGVTLDPGMLATIPAWTGGRSANTVHVARLALFDVKLAVPNVPMDPLSGEIVFAANGTVEHAVLSNDKLKINADLQQNAVKVALSARDWRAPFGPPLTFSYLTLEGIADKDRFASTHLEGRVGGGNVTGTLAARWDGRTTVGGELKVQGARMDEAAQQLAPNFRVKGVLNANVRYAMQADSASGLMEHAMVDGGFAITRGELGGVDLARAVQLPGTPAGGRTAFEELKGSVRIGGGQFDYRNLQLSSGPLDATGFVNVAPSGQLTGRIDAQITSRSAVVARTSFALRGTVKDPQLVR